MATGYTGEYTSQTYRKIRGKLDYTYTTSDTQYVFTLTGTCQEKDSYQYGCFVETEVQSPAGTIFNSGRATGYLSSNPGSSWKDVCKRSSAKMTVSRGSSAKTAYMRIRVGGVTVSGYGAFPVTGSWVNIATITVAKLPVYAPLAPTGVSNTKTSNTLATIKWTRNTSTVRPVTGQSLWRSLNGAAYSNISTLSSTATSATSALSNNNSYRYRIRATNSAGSTDSAVSGIIYTTPSNPSGLTAAASGTNAIVKWTANSRYITSVQLQRATNSGFTSGVTTYTLGASVTSYTNATGGGVFYYRVRNICSGGTTAWSNVAQVTTMLAPDPPTNLRRPAPYNTNTFVLNWTNVVSTTKPYSSIQIRALPSDQDGVMDDIATVGGSDTSYSWSAPNAGPWNFAIRSVNAIGNSAWVYIDPRYNYGAVPVPGSGDEGAIGEIFVDKAHVSASWHFDGSGWENNLDADVQYRLAPWKELAEEVVDDDGTVVTPAELPEWGDWVDTQDYEFTSNTLSCSLVASETCFVQFRASISVIDPPDGEARSGDFVLSNWDAVRFSPAPAALESYDTDTNELKFTLRGDDIGSSAGRTVSVYLNGDLYTSTTYDGDERSVVATVVPPQSFFTVTVGIKNTFWPFEVFNSTDDNLDVSYDNSEILIDDDRYAVFLVYEDGTIVPASVTVIDPL